MIKLVQLLSFSTFFFNVQTSVAQMDMPKDFAIILRPLIDITTGLDDSSYSKIEKSLTKVLNEKFEVSEFSSFPHKVVASCVSENNTIGLGKKINFETNLKVKLILIDLISKQSFGEKTFDLSGAGESQTEAFDMALKLMEKQQKGNINSFLNDAYMGLMLCYESKCAENMGGMRELSPMSMPEDILIKFMSVPAMIHDCKMQANEELLMMYSDYSINKCEEFDMMLDMAITEKNKEGAKDILIKMSYLSSCEEQVELHKPKLIKMKIPVDQILLESKKVKFDAMEIDRGQLSKKIAEVLLLVMDLDQGMNNDPGIMIMKMEAVNQILNAE